MSLYPQPLIFLPKKEQKNVVQNCTVFESQMEHKPCHFFPNVTPINPHQGF